jgi:hypothetical protein
LKFVPIELSFRMVPLHAPNPNNRKGLTASQWLYREYVSAKRKHDWQRMKAAGEALVRICIQACGKIRPFWSPKVPEGVELLRPYATFRVDGVRDRRDFAETFLEGELKRRMTATEARHVARRCKLRLIDEIRSDTRRAHGFGRKSNEQYRAALKKVKHLQPSWKWNDDSPRRLWQHIKGSCAEWRDATNVSIASDWYRSEGWIRKVRKRLAVRLWSVAENDEQREALRILRLMPREAPAAPKVSGS